jgi:hypothetical protein
MILAVKQHIPLPHTLTRRNPVTKQIEHIQFAPWAEISDKDPAEKKWLDALLKYQGDRFYIPDAGKKPDASGYTWRNQFKGADFAKKFEALAPKHQAEVMSLIDARLKAAAHPGAPTLKAHQAQETAAAKAEREAQAAKAKADAEAATKKAAADKKAADKKGE